MKAQKNHSQRSYLKKNNNRWKWMAGATAATGVTAAQASAITINLVGNYISATGGNHLNADLTGDGHPDLTIANAFFYVYRYGSPGSFSFNRYYATVRLNGIGAQAFAYIWRFSGHVLLGSQYKYFDTYRTPYSASLTGSIPIFFKDLHINGGAPTMGSLDVTVFASLGDAGVQLDSFTYDTPVQGSGLAVPEQGSSLTLLAMGAGGVLALRRWRAAKEHC